MKTDDFINVMSGKKGQFVKLSWKRKVKTAAAFKDFNVEKETSAVVRTGIIYDNIKTIKEKRENGELPSVNAGLPWGEWKEFPFVITHKGEDYARIYKSPNHVPSCRYFVNNEEVSFDFFLTFLTDSDMRKEKSHEKTVNDVFTVKMNDLEIIE